jgi:hypothetical protein
MSHSQSTTDHALIRKWIESRQGHPAVVKATAEQRSQNRGHAGLLRVDFEPADESLSEVSWEDFFDTFDARQLMFVYQDTAANGAPSRFCKFVRRDVDGATGAGQQRQRQASPRKATEREEQEAEEADEDEAWEAEEAADADESSSDVEKGDKGAARRPKSRNSKRGSDGK